MVKTARLEAEWLSLPYCVKEGVGSQLWAGQTETGAQVRVCVYTCCAYSVDSNSLWEIPCHLDCSGADSWQVWSLRGRTKPRSLRNLCRPSSSQAGWGRVGVGVDVAALLCTLLALPGSAPSVQKVAALLHPQKPFLHL